MEKGYTLYHLIFSAFRRLILLGFCLFHTSTKTFEGSSELVRIAQNLSRVYNGPTRSIKCFSGLQSRRGCEGLALTRPPPYTSAPTHGHFLEACNQRAAQSTRLMLRYKLPTGMSLLQAHTGMSLLQAHPPAPCRVALAVGVDLIDVPSPVRVPWSEICGCVNARGGFTGYIELWEQRCKSSSIACSAIS